jgi:hypothetical protein
MALGWRGSYARYREFFLNISELYKKRADLRAFLEIILSLTTITIFLLFALKPTVITIIGLLQQIKEEQVTLAALTQKVSNLQVAAGLLTQNQNFIPDIDTAVPTSPVPDILSGQILGLAAKDSVDILGISVDQVTLVGPVTGKGATGLKALPGNAKEMSFSVSVKGTYPNLVLFIKDFENMRITKVIDTLATTSSVTDKGLVIVSVISGRVPFLGK